LRKYQKINNDEMIEEEINENEIIEYECLKKEYIF
jgi:hypothetical protein